MSEPKSSREQFAPVAAAYLTSDAHARPDEIGEIVSEFVTQPGRFLDVGTGAGHMAFALAPKATSVVAFDLTPEMLDVVAEEAERRSLTNIQTCQGLAEHMPFADESFDGVACRVAAHHFRHVEAFVAEVRRVLAPGGWFILIDTVSPEESDADAELNKFETLRDPSHFRNWRPSEWRKFVADNGMTVVAENVGAKRMDFDAWLDRMRVPAERRTEIESMVWTPGVLADVIRPRVHEGARSFELPEYVMVARAASTFS